jgi:hypothetical protein
VAQRCDRAAIALAVFELRDDLRDTVWAVYGCYWLLLRVATPSRSSGLSSSERPIGVVEPLPG